MISMLITTHHCRLYFCLTRIGLTQNNLKGLENEILIKLQVHLRLLDRQEVVGLTTYSVREISIPPDDSYVNPLRLLFIVLFHSLEL